MGLCLSAGSAPLEAAPAASSAAVAVEVPELTVRELQKATGSFSPSRQIGKGRFATVYWASLQNGRIAAAKRLDLPSTAGRWDAVTVLRQKVNVTSRLSHQNVVRLLGCTVTDDLGVVLYELAPMGTLHDALHGSLPHQAARPCLSWAQRVRIALDTASGLQYMHEQAPRSTTHGDVRSTNVLLFEGFRAKVGDNNLFRDAQVSDKPMRLPFGVLPAVYTATEVCGTGRVTPKSDVFSFGVVLLELLTGFKPTDSRLEAVIHGRATPMVDLKLGTHYPPDRARKLATIAMQCLQMKPSSRPSMTTVARNIEFGVVQEDTTAGEGCSGSAMKSGSASS